MKMLGDPPRLDDDGPPWWAIIGVIIGVIMAIFVMALIAE